MKTDLKKAGFVLGKVKISRYLNSMNEKLEAEFIASKYEIPATRTKKDRKKNKDDEQTFEDLGKSIDNWKNRGNDGSINKFEKVKNSNTKSFQNRSNKKIFFNDKKLLLNTDN